MRTSNPIIGMQLLNSVACSHMSRGKAVNKTMLSVAALCAAYVLIVFGERSGKRDDDVVEEDFF
jgi:hypothetical protein